MFGIAKPGSDKVSGTIKITTPGIFFLAHISKKPIRTVKGKKYDVVYLAKLEPLADLVVLTYSQSFYKKCKAPFFAMMNKFLVLKC